MEIYKENYNKVKDLLKEDLCYGCFDVMKTYKNVFMYWNNGILLAWKPNI